MGLAKLRKEAGLSLHQLARKSGVNYQKIFQIEKGIIKVEHIMLRTAKRLADALGCVPEDLLTPDELPEESAPEAVLTEDNDESAGAEPEENVPKAEANEPADDTDVKKSK